MADETKVDLQLFNKKGEKVAFPSQLPKEFATKFVEFNGVRYERDKTGGYYEVGKAEGVETDVK